MPRIEIPRNVVEADGSLAFKIETHDGVIEVSGYNRWRCRGTVAALVAGGLLRHDWVPGLPGNNKVRQTVAFEAYEPRLLCGLRRGQKTKSPHIVITRKSARLYEVEIPTTKEQSALIDAARKRFRQRCDDERRKDEAARVNEEIAKLNKAMSKSELRQECLDFVGCVHLAIHKSIESSSFRPDAGMMRKMDGIIDDLKECILQGELRPEYIEQGNVVALRRAGAH